MTRTARRTRPPVVGFVLVIVAALAAAIVFGSEVGARAGADPSITLVAAPTGPDQNSYTLAVSFDPGESAIAALGATLRFDDRRVTVHSCAVSEAGACNVDGDQVLFSVFDVRRLDANDRLVTVDFDPVPGAVGAQFDLAVDTAVAPDGSHVPEFAVAPLDLSFEPAARGALTGEVVGTGSPTGLYGIDVCALDAGGRATCTSSTGLGTWRIDDLAVGAYTIEAQDPSGVLGSVTGTATVVADQITTVETLAMDLATAMDAGVPGGDVPTALADEPAESAPAESAPAEPAPAAPTPEPIVYEASIAGRVSDVATGEPVEGAQVCATQPLVLHQSCASTGADGTFGLRDLSTGNYWVEVGDPLGRYAEPSPVLVGVNGDQAARTGVQVRLSPAD